MNLHLHSYDYSSIALTLATDIDGPRENGQRLRWERGGDKPGRFNVGWWNCFRWLVGGTLDVMSCSM